MPTPNFEEATKAIDGLLATFEEFKTATDESIAELKSKGAVDPILEEKVGKIDSRVQDLSDQIQAAGEKTHEQILNIETAMNRSGGDQTLEQRDQEVEDVKMMNRNAIAYGRAPTVTLVEFRAYTKAFDRYMRKDDRILSIDEYKALAIGSDPDGGYWVVPEVSAAINAVIRETSPMRELASGMTIGSKSVTMVIDDGQAGVGWLGETETPSETTSPTIREKEIVAHTGYAEPRATMEMLDDANINIEEWLAAKVSDRLARQENTAFVSGTGVGQPRGFVTYASGTSYGQIQQVASGSAADFTFDGLIDIQNTLKEGYQPNATWLFKRANIANVRKLKDGNGQYLWQPNNQLGEAPLLLGRPVRHADDIAAVAANALAAAYGDFRRGYQIVDRLGIRVQRDALTSKPFVKFFTTKRVGGDVVNFEAIKLQKLST